MKILRKFKHLQLIFILMLIINIVNPKPSHAVAPLLVPAGYVAGAALITAAGYVYYSNPVGITSANVWATNNALTLGRAVMAMQNTVNAYGQSVTNGWIGIAQAKITELAQLVLPYDPTYPQLAALFYKTDGAQINPNAVPTVGTYYSNYGTCTSSSVQTLSGWGGWVVPIPQSGTNISWYVPVNPPANWGTGTALTLKRYSASFDNSSAPPRSAKSEAELSTSFPAGFPITAPGQISELDNLLANNQGSFSIIDAVDPKTDSKTPLVPPAIVNPVSPSTVKPVTGFGDADVSSKNAAAANAATVLANAKDAYASNPTAENQAIVDAAQVAADAAASAATVAAAEAATVYPDAGQDEIKQFDWTKWKSLVGAMSNIFPFNLLSTIPTLIGKLVAEPVAPNFDVILFGQTQNISLSIFDTIASIFRWAISILMTIGIVQAVVRFYRGA